MRQRALVLCLYLGSLASVAGAQQIERSGRFGLSTVPLRFESLSAEDSDAVTRFTAGLGVPGLGLTFGAATSNNAIINVHLLLAHTAVETPGGGSGSATVVELLPELEYVFTSKSDTRGHISLLAGVSHTAESSDASLTTFAIGPGGGAHFFLGPHASIDLGVHALYVNGSPSGSDLVISGFTLAAKVGVSVWFGGATNREPAESGRREQDDDVYRSTSHAAAPTSSSRVGMESAAGRSFDRARNVHVLKAQFNLGGTRLTLLSAPQADLETIFMQLDVQRYAASPQACVSLAALINEQPIAATSPATSADRMIEISGRLHFDHFRALGRQHATFGVEACGQQWRLQAEQMPDLIKFLQLVSQVATDVQQGRLPRHAAPAPAEPAPATPAVPAPVPGEPPAAAPAPGQPPAPPSPPPGQPPPASPAPAAAPPGPVTPGPQPQPQPRP